MTPHNILLIIASFLLKRVRGFEGSRVLVLAFLFDHLNPCLPAPVPTEGGAGSLTPEPLQFI